jgi:nucleoside-diphosphate-sugar epimerase
VLELVRRGEKVRVLDNFLTGHRRNLASVLPQIELFEHDITDPKTSAPAFKGVTL